MELNFDVFEKKKNATDTIIARKLPKTSSKFEIHKNAEHGEALLPSLITPNIPEETM